MKIIKKGLQLLENERVQVIILLLIAAVFLFTRFVFLSRVPAGMHVDEYGAAYDCQCLAHYGVDRYLTKFPPYLKNYGGGQSVLYAYTAALIVKFFGFSVEGFRAVAGIYATIAFICLYFLGRLIFNEKKYALIPPFLMTIMPVFFMAERWGLDCNLFLSLSIISLFCLAKAGYSKNPVWFILSGISLGITLYTYAISYAVIPVFLVLSLIYLMSIKSIKPSQVFCLAIPLIIVGLPIFLEQLVNSGRIPEFSTSFMDFKRMNDYRGGEFSVRNIVPNLPGLWKIYSSDSLNYSANKMFGTLYYVSIPFILIGIIVCLKKTFDSFKNRKFDMAPVFIIYYVVSLFIGLITEEININRVNGIYSVLLIFTAYGIAFIWKKFELFPAVIIPVYLAFFLAFGIFYFCGSFNESISAANTWGLFQKRDMGEAVKYLKEKYNDEKKVWIMANDGTEWRIIIAAMTGTSPYEFAEEGYEENNYEIGIPEELDISGDCVYVIRKDLHHVTDYLQTEGFTVDDSNFGNYSVVYK